MSDNSTVTVHSSAPEDMLAKSQATGKFKAFTSKFLNKSLPLYQAVLFCYYLCWR